MKRLNTRYAIEAFICGAPVTAIAVYGIPFLLAVAVSQLATSTSNSLLSIAICLGCILALITFWRLAIHTIENKPFRFNTVYWASVAAAVAGGFSTSRFFPAESVVIFILAPAACAAHFSLVQRQWVKNAT